MSVAVPGLDVVRERVLVVDSGGQDVSVPVPDLKAGGDASARVGLVRYGHRGALVQWGGVDLEGCAGGAVVVARTSDDDRRRSGIGGVPIVGREVGYVVELPSVDQHRGNDVVGVSVVLHVGEAQLDRYAIETHLVDLELVLKRADEPALASDADGRRAGVEVVLV